MAREARFRNPEFQEKLARARAYERRIGSSQAPRYLALAAALAVLYFLAISQTFLVKEAGINENGPTVEQLQSILSRMQHQRLWFLIPQNHILILDKALLLPELRKDLPEVRTIKVLKKSWPNRVNLVLELREERYVWQSGLNYYLLDQDGVVFARIPSYTPEAFGQPLIADNSAAEIAPGTTLPIQPAIKFIEDIQLEWPEKISETNIVSFAVPAARSKDIIVKTSIGFSLYFDLQRSAAEQLSDLKLVLREQIRPETFSGLSYIDLRLPSIAYYCYQDALCAPENATSTPPTN